MRRSKADVEAERGTVFKVLGYAATLTIDAVAQATGLTPASARARLKELVASGWAEAVPYVVPFVTRRGRKALAYRVAAKAIEVPSEGV